MAVRPYRWLTTLENIKRNMTLTETTDEDAKLKRLIEQASRFVEKWTRRRFLPVIETRVFDFQRGQRLIFDEDLLSITTVSDDDGEIASSDYFLYPANKTPKLYMEILSSTGEYFSYTDTRQQCITIVGVWGYTDDYEDTGTSLSLDVDETTTLLTIVSGALEVGQSLLLDTEAVFVSAVSGNAVTVVRGTLGTTAAAHTTAVVVYVYVPPFDITFATELLVARWHKRHFAGWADQVGEEAGFRMYGSAPDEAKRIMNNYKRYI